MTTAVQSPLSLSSRRVACARTSASHGGVAPSFLKRARASFACVCVCVCVSVLLFFQRGWGVCVCVCLKACPSSSKERGVFSAVKKRVNPSSLSFSSSIKRFRFRLDFLLRRANKNTRRNFFSLTFQECTHSLIHIGSTRKGKKKSPRAAFFCLHHHKN